MDINNLLSSQNECTLSWVRANGNPASTVVSFIYLDGKIWMTSLASSGRVKAIRNKPDVSVVVSGKGTELGHSRCVSIQGRCEIFSDQEIRDKFFPLFARAVLPDSEKGASMMANMMNSPENLVLVVTPDRTIPYDAHDQLEMANRM
jgi:nitroimidazol reductase NimA-like FMN-containing flavoprotein (pyridoxamine 5'-phosphate oxidase superfamily)